MYIVTINGRRKQQWLFPYRYQISTHLQRRGFSKDLSINKKEKKIFKKEEERKKRGSIYTVKLIVILSAAATV